MGSGGSDNTYSAPAAACAAEILSALKLSRRPLSLADLERRLPRTKSLIFRVLYELTDKEFVSKDPSGRYRIGVEAFEVGSSYLLNVDKVGLLGEILQEVTDQIAETVNLGILRDDEIVYLMKSDAPSTFVTISRIGGRVPAPCIAIGKATLATLSDAEIRQRLQEPLPSLTPSSVASLDELLRELETVRITGFAYDEEEAVLGRSGIAVSLQRRPGQEPLGISVSTDAARFPDMKARLRELLDAARNRINREVIDPGGPVNLVAEVER